MNKVACPSIWLYSSCLLTALLGCGRRSSLDLAPVLGTVSYQGKALTHGRVVFYPIDGKVGPPATGEIATDGSFRLETLNHEGALIGQHRITVYCREPLTREQALNSSYISPALIPTKYFGKESPLRFEVKDADNQYTIELE